MAGLVLLKDLVQVIQRCGELGAGGGTVGGEIAIALAVHDAEFGDLFDERGVPRVNWNIWVGRRCRRRWCCGRRRAG